MDPESECANVWIKKRTADEAVLSDLKWHVAAFLDERERQLKKKAQGKSPEAELRKAEDELKNAEVAKRFLFEKLADRSIDRGTFKAKKAGYDQEIESIKEKIRAIRASLDDEEETEVDKSVLDEKELTKDIWDKYIESVDVFPDSRLEIKFKF